jgi:hypothetical protein
MAYNNKLELIVEVDVNQANSSIKSVNTDLSSMKRQITADYLSARLFALIIPGLRAAGRDNTILVSQLLNDRTPKSPQYLQQPRRQECVVWKSWHQPDPSP